MQDNPELEGQGFSVTTRKVAVLGDVYTELSSRECITKASTGDSGGAMLVVHEQGYGGSSAEPGQLLRVV